MAGAALTRNCLCCKESFSPDRRNCHHQRYCSKPDCRRASKRQSQRQWLAQPRNQSYFRGPENVARVREWRRAHPGYWRRSTGKSSAPLQEDCPTQVPAPVVVESGSVQELCADALQDLCQAQLPLLVGLMHQLLDSPLQEDILPFARRLIAKGQDLLDRPSQRRPSASAKTVHAPQATPAPGPSAARSTPVQLGRSPIGPTTTAP